MSKMLLGLLCLLALSATAFAADLSDDDYVTKFFGTTALFTTPHQLANPETEWWGDKMPQQLTGGAAYIAGLVNARRMDAGITPLLNPQDALVVLIGEDPVEGGFQYSIDFAGMRPSEVQLVVDNLGGTEKLIPGSKLTFRPLNRSSIFLSGKLGDTLKVVIGGEELELAPAMTTEAFHGKVAEVLKRKYGETVVFDLYRDFYINRDSSGQDISIYIEVPTDLVPPLEMPEGD